MHHLAVRHWRNHLNTLNKKKMSSAPLATLHTHRTFVSPPITHQNFPFRPISVLGHPSLPSGGWGESQRPRWKGHWYNTTKSNKSSWPATHQRRKKNHHSFHGSTLAQTQTGKKVYEDVKTTKLLLTRRKMETLMMDLTHYECPYSCRSASAQGDGRRGCS